jgi:hypothetical protein
MLNISLVLDGKLAKMLSLVGPENIVELQRIINLGQMKKLHLGDGSITEHNSRFQLLVSQTGMKDSLALMDLYRETLPWGLQSLIIRSEHPPKTLEELYTKATNFYVGHRRAQHLFRK